MSAKRGDAVERPNPWEFVFKDLDAAKGWAELVRASPAATDQAWVAVTSDPKRTDARQHQLKGKVLSTGSYQGAAMAQWQYEVTGAGRIWYLIDEQNRRLVLSHAGTGHPKATDSRRHRGNS